MAFEMETAIIDFYVIVIITKQSTSPAVVVMHQKFALILFLITTLHLLLLPAVSFLPGETFVRPFAGKTGMLIRKIGLSFWFTEDCLSLVDLSRCFHNTDT